MSLFDHFVVLGLYGYLHYKTIISQSVAQVNIFLFRRKVMFRSQDIQVFLYF